MFLRVTRQKTKQKSKKVKNHDKKLNVLGIVH